MSRELFHSIDLNPVSPDILHTKFLPTEICKAILASALEKNTWEYNPRLVYHTDDIHFKEDLPEWYDIIETGLREAFNTASTYWGVLYVPLFFWSCASLGRALLERQIIYMTINTGSRGQGTTRRNLNAVRTGRSTGPKTKAYSTPSRTTGREKPGESQEVTQTQRATARLTPEPLSEQPLKEKKARSPMPRRQKGRARQAQKRGSEGE